jgi:hypothetical protein
MGRFNVLERRVTRFLHEPPTVRGAAGDRELMERRFDELERKLDDFAATR